MGLLLVESTFTFKTFASAFHFHVYLLLVTAAEHSNVKAVEAAFNQL